MEGRRKLFEGRAMRRLLTMIMALALLFTLQLGAEERLSVSKISYQVAG